MSVRVYSRATVASVPSTDTRFVTDAAQAGLIAGTVPTNGTEKLAQVGQHDGRGGIAGNDHQIGPVRRDQFADQADDARHQRRFIAVGKAGIVGDIDEIGVRPRRRDLTIDGEAAEAGIEHRMFSRAAMARLMP